MEFSKNKYLTEVENFSLSENKIREKTLDICIWEKSIPAFHSKESIKNLMGKLWNFTQFQWNIG